MPKYDNYGIFDFMWGIIYQHTFKISFSYAIAVGPEDETLTGSSSFTYTSVLSCTQPLSHTRKCNKVEFVVQPVSCL